MLAKPAVIVVSGWRDWPEIEAHLVTAELQTLRSAGLVGLVVDGGCSGVDTIAHGWAVGEGIETKRFSADWNAGKAAGPLRNVAMLDWARSEAEQRGCLVGLFAFPGPKSRGTHDCIKAAKERKIEVVVHSHPDTEVSSYELRLGVCDFCRAENVELWPFFNSRHICPFCYDLCAPEKYK